MVSPRGRIALAAPTPEAVIPGRQCRARHSRRAEVAAEGCAQWQQLGQRPHARDAPARQQAPHALPTKPQDPTASFGSLQPPALRRSSSWVPATTHAALASASALIHHPLATGPPHGDAVPRRGGCHQCGSCLHAEHRAAICIVWASLPRTRYADWRTSRWVRCPHQW